MAFTFQKIILLVRITKTLESITCIAQFLQCIPCCIKCFFSLFSLSSSFSCCFFFCLLFRQSLSFLFLYTLTILLLGSSPGLCLLLLPLQPVGGMRTNTIELYGPENMMTYDPDLRTSMQTISHHKHTPRLLLCILSLCNPWINLISILNKFS